MIVTKTLNPLVLALLSLIVVLRLDDFLELGWNLTLSSYKCFIVALNILD